MTRTTRQDDDKKDCEATASSDIQTSADNPNLNGFYRSLFLSVFSVSSVSISPDLLFIPGKNNSKPSENMDTDDTDDTQDDDKKGLRATASSDIQTSADIQILTVFIVPYFCPCFPCRPCPISPDLLFHSRQEQLRSRRRIWDRMTRTTRQDDGKKDCEATASSDVQTSADVPNLNGFYRSLFLSVYSVSSVSISPDLLFHSRQDNSEAVRRIWDTDDTDDTAGRPQKRIARQLRVPTSKLRPTFQILTVFIVPYFCPCTPCRPCRISPDLLPPTIKRPFTFIVIDSAPDFRSWPKI